MAISMILYGAIAAVTILLSCLVQNKGITKEYGITITRQQLLNRICITAVFIILFLLAALRLEVGNDYGTYVTTCHEIFQKGYVVTEPGYNLVVRILYTLSGKEDYLLMFAVFAFATSFIFIKSIYDQSDDFTLGFFLFMTLGIYFRSFNTVRYYFVLAITLYSLRYVVKKEYVKFIILILLAALFHKSVLVVIPVYILANRRFKKWQLIVMTAFCVSLIFGKDLYMQLALKLYPSYVNTPYLNETAGVLGSIQSIGRCVAVLVLCLVFYRDSIKDSAANRLYFNLNLMAIALYLCGSFIPLVSRFGYYLMTAHILLIPGVLAGIQNQKKKKWVTVLVVLAGILYFFVFLRSASAEGVRVLPYKTWLFYEKEWLDATKIF